MYFIDREKINHTLTYMETIQTHSSTLDEDLELTEKLALERIASVMIESIIDVGNSMIDGFIMRDPGGYEDIIEILEDEKVIGSESANSLKKLITLRKHLVQDFIAMDHDHIAQTLRDSEQALLSFPNDVRRYLEEELGPVSAFLPNEGK